VILHLAPEADWRAIPEGAAYAPDSLRTEGFVHCTAGEELLLRVANTFYAAIPGAYVVLDVDETRLTSEVRWEAPLSDDPLAAVAQFPHVYGPLDRAAVVRVRALQRDDSGRFVGIGP
jgi:uncharacterized protein (DUF952 family)